MGGAARGEHCRQLGTDVFDRHFHQRGGDFSLLFKVTGQPLGREPSRERAPAHAKRKSLL